MVGYLSTFTTDATSQLDIADHDGDTLAVDGTQVDIFEQANQVSFSGFLQSSDSSGLEAQVSLGVLSDFTDKTLEGELADQQFSRLLVATNFTESNSTGSVAVRLLDAGSGSALASSLGGDLLAGSLTTGRFASSLLSTSHVVLWKNVESRQVDGRSRGTRGAIYTPTPVQTIDPPRVPADWLKKDFGGNNGRQTSLI